MRKALLLFQLFFISLHVFAQSDTTFWFAAPDISSAFNYDRPIVFRITSYQQPCNVSISQPAGGGLPVQTISLPANSTQTVTLSTWLANIECAPGNVVQDKGIKISSDNKISVYYEVNVNGPNPEIFALKGRNALGTQFYISSQNILDNNTVYSPIPTSSFNIVATEDNCIVTINPTANIVGHLANAQFTITLNKGQTYAAIAVSSAAAQHLQGSFVSSTKPIAITLSDDLLDGSQYYSGTCHDLAGDQTVPVNVTGMEYIAFKSNLNPPYDKLFITATQNSTTVTQDGIFVATLSAGQSAQLTIATPVTYVQTSAPAYAYQLAGYGCEVGSAILPKLNCTGSSTVAITRSTNEFFYLTLLVKNGGQGNFLINNTGGVITGAQFNAVPGTAGVWYYAKVSLALGSYPNGSVVRVSNTSDIFQMGVLQGGNLSGDSFGYFSDFNTLEASASTTTPSICPGTDISLFAQTIASAIYSWTGPNNFNSNLQNPVISNSNPVNSGNYILSVTIPGCGTYNDTISVTVKPKRFSTIDQSICPGQTFEGHSSTGTYVDVFTASNGCDSLRTLNLIVKPRSFSTVTQTICEGQTYAGYGLAGTYVDTIVAANGCDSVRTLNLIVKPRAFSATSQVICEGQSYLGHSTSGTFIDTLGATNGCDSLRTLVLTVKPSAYSNFTKSICTGDTFEGYGTSGTYIDTLVGFNGCDSIRTINLTVDKISIPYLGLDRTLCIGDTILLSPGSYRSYLWQDGFRGRTYVVRQAGLYSATVSNGCGDFKDEVYISGTTCQIYFPNAFTPNKDGSNDVFNILNGFGFDLYSLRIYNRWGQKIFESSDYKKGWDGMIKKQPADPGTYVWYCKFTKSSVTETMQGTVILIR